MQYLGIISARAGSKTIPNKNIYKINKFPLIYYSIKAFQESSIRNNFYVSTDGLKIKTIAASYGARIIDRPSNISTDVSSSIECLIHAINCFKCKPEILVLVQPTSPLISGKYIDDMVKQIIESKRLDCIISCNLTHPILWQPYGENIVPYNHKISHRNRRQDSGHVLEENGMIYCIRTNKLIENYVSGNSSVVFGNVGKYIIPKYRSFQIDDYDDIVIVESIIKNLYSN
jgi:CMP-N-acetylneuraminic acid synthetase